MAQPDAAGVLDSATMATEFVGMVTGGGWRKPCNHRRRNCAEFNRRCQLDQVPTFRASLIQGCLLLLYRPLPAKRVCMGAEVEARACLLASFRGRRCFACETHSARCFLGWLLELRARSADAPAVPLAIPLPVEKAPIPPSNSFSPDFLGLPSLASWPVRAFQFWI